MYAGVYHLDIYEPNLKFRKYKVDVSSRKGGTIRALSKPFPGGENKLETYPLGISPIAPETYFRVRSAANPLAMIFRNPIFLIMGVFALLKVFAGKIAPPEEGGSSVDGGPAVEGGEQPAGRRIRGGEGGGAGGVRAKKDVAAPVRVARDVQGGHDDEEEDEVVDLDDSDTDADMPDLATTEPATESKASGGAKQSAANSSNTNNKARRGKHE